MSEKVTINALIEGGHASAGPPIGPALGPTGVNLYQVVEKINELSKDFAGLKIPVKITVDTTTKKFEIEVLLPPTSALIIREIADAKKGSATTSTTKIGNISIETVKKIAKMKKEVVLSTELKKAAKEIIGTCLSMGVTVEGKSPKKIQKDIDNGLYDNQLNQEL